ncbi:AAA family ATPase [Fredinandcohnia humi]
MKRDIRGMKIALTGEMRSGKDTIADYLQKEYYFTRFAFGDAIKFYCEAIFPGVTKNGQKPRALYQEFGQFCRQFDPDVWVNYLFREMERTINAGLSVVITDLRQPNEYNALLKAGFAIVRVNTKTAYRILRMKESGDSFKLEDLQHETESHIRSFDVDFELYNNDSLKELYSQVDVMLTNI